MSFHLIEGDITEVEADAVVNAANSALMRGGGVCGAIFAAAGARQLQRACERLAPVRTGLVAVTDGFDLKAKRIIHAVGPVWQGGHNGEKEALSSCYTRALEICSKEGLRSIAFPLISSGIYGYPVDDAYRVARDVIKSYLESHDIEVYLVIFGKRMAEHLSTLD